MQDYSIIDGLKTGLAAILMPIVLHPGMHQTRARATKTLNRKKERHNKDASLLFWGFHWSDVFFCVVAIMIRPRTTIQMIRPVRTGLLTRPGFQSYNPSGGTALESRPHMFNNRGSTLLFGCGPRPRQGIRGVFTAENARDA